MYEYEIAHVTGARCRWHRDCSVQYQPTPFLLEDDPCAHINVSSCSAPSPRWCSSASRPPARRRAIAATAGDGSVVVVVGGGYYAPYYDAYFLRPVVRLPVSLSAAPYPYGYHPVAPDSSVRLDVKPKKAEVYVDGFYAGIVDDFDGTFQRLRVEPGEHEIELWLDGYGPCRQKVYLTPDNTFKHQVLDGAARRRQPQEPKPQPQPHGAARAAISRACSRRRCSSSRRNADRPPPRMPPPPRQPQQPQAAGTAARRPGQRVVRHAGHQGAAG